MIIGSRTHDYGKQPIKELAPLLKKEGIGAAQIVLPKGFQEISSYEDVTATALTQIRESFLENQVKIHILGCYMDLGNPDEEIRKEAVATFKKCLLYAKELGAALVGTETAYPRLSREEKAIWRPFMMDSIARIVEAAETLGQDMAIEPVFWHPLEDLEITATVFEKFNSNHLKMIFDGANVLENPSINQGEYWKQWLDSLGDKIEALHIKDFTEGPNKEYQPVTLGNGVMDYTEIVRWMKAYKPNIVAVREELVPATAKQDIQYMKAMWQ